MSIAIKPDLTIEELPALFQFEPKSGLLTWRKNTPSTPRSAGAIVGSGGRGHYRILRYNGRTYPVHHLVWALHHGQWPKQIDHIDGNKLNNRMENLRECTSSQNSHNVGLTRRNSSGYKGVSWHAVAQKWTASIMASGKSRYLGLFDTAKAAAAAYDKAANELHGEFAKTNADMVPKKVAYLTGEPSVRMYDPRGRFKAYAGGC